MANLKSRDFFKFVNNSLHLFYWESTHYTLSDYFSKFSTEIKKFSISSLVFESSWNKIFTTYKIETQKEERVFI